VYGRGVCTCAMKAGSTHDAQSKPSSAFSFSQATLKTRKEGVRGVGRGGGREGSNREPEGFVKEGKGQEGRREEEERGGGGGE
jgi:hypothetical protein